MHTRASIRQYDKLYSYYAYVCIVGILIYYGIREGNMHNIHTRVCILRVLLEYSLVCTLWILCILLSMYIISYGSFMWILYSRVVPIFTEYAY